jgi:hypothetical protein
MLSSIVSASEIDPTPVVAAAFFGNQHDLALDDAGIADQRAPRLDDDLGQVVAEMACDRRHHRLGIALHSRHLAAVMRREAAADIDHPQVDIGLGERREHPRRGAHRAVPLSEVGLLRADMERNAVRIEAGATGPAQ